MFTIQNWGGGSLYQVLKFLSSFACKNISNDIRDFEGFYESIRQETDQHYIRPTANKL